MANQRIFLFSIDLEDIRFRTDNGDRYSPRVDINTNVYLEWLSSIDSKCTFFVEGRTAKYYPDLIKRIVSEGHELGCHTTNHIPLDKQGPASFKTDIIENKKILEELGGIKVEGFRAPIFSLTEKTSWAYQVLEELGFRYSSSVLPAQNPLYGFPEFGSKPKQVGSLWEIPMTLSNLPFLNVPYAGGVYFRFLPFQLIKYLFKKNDLILGYFHPYDLDYEQERFLHPDINSNQFYNFLMYYNREKVISRLNCLMKELNPKVITFKEYLELLK